MSIKAELPACGTADPQTRLAEFPDHLYVWAFPRWKWRFVKRCFPGRRLHFVGPGARIDHPGGLVLWGVAEHPSAIPHDWPVVRMEDGFLRSVGLGAELTRPLSWVIDTRGMYYDPSQPSDLEWLLAQSTFSDECLARAAALHRAIVDAGVTKYNVGRNRWQRPRTARRVILVPGQVESDASIARGGAGIRNNIDLLHAVRAAHPDAYVLYKPHPDVEAGLRRQGRGEARAEQGCDELVRDVGIEHLLTEVDEVHTMTSLAGFEALLRGKQVVCYGQPFYAGWGLTQDIAPIARRARRLNLKSLIAGTLIAYPLYLAMHENRLVQPEEALASLQSWKRNRQGKSPWWSEIYRMILRRAIGVR